MNDELAGLLAREDPPEFRFPARPDQAFDNGKGLFWVRSYLRDVYQARLAESSWLNRLAQELRSYPELDQKVLLVQLRPRFNRATLDHEDEDSGCKNQFLLDVIWALPASSPMDVRYHYEVAYQPNSPESPFVLLARRASYVWRPESDYGDLEDRLLRCGILREVVAPNHPDRELAEIAMTGTLDRPEFVPVEKRMHVLSVAIGEARSFPSDLAAREDSHCLVEPVLVRDRRQLEAFRENLYRGLIGWKKVDLQGFAPAENSSLREISEEQWSAVVETFRDKEHFFLTIADDVKFALMILVSPSSILVSCHLSGIFLSGVPAPGVWDDLIRLSRDEEIWRPNRGRHVWAGETWMLKRADADFRVVELCSPPACPLVEFCLEFMRLVGLELEVKRTVRWHKPG